MTAFSVCSPSVWPGCVAVGSHFMATKLLEQRVELKQLDGIICITVRAVCIIDDKILLYLIFICIDTRDMLYMCIRLQASVMLTVAATLSRPSFGVVICV